MREFRYSKKYEKFIPVYLVREVFLALVAFILRFQRAPVNSSEHYLIIALGRSGTSAICSEMSKHLNLVNLKEIFHYPVFSPAIYYFRLMRLISRATQRGTVTKLLTYQVDKFSLNIAALAKICQENNVKVLFITRNNFDQALSVCYSNQTHIWHNKRNNVNGRNVNLRDVEVSPAEFVTQLERQALQNQILDKCRSAFSRCEVIPMRYEAFKDGGLLSALETKVDLRGHAPELGEYHLLSKGGVRSRVKNSDELLAIYKEFSQSS